MDAPPTSDAAAQYRQRRSHQLDRAARLQRQDLRLGLAKLAMVLVLVLAAWLALIRHLFPSAALALPVVILAVLFVVHDRVIRARRRADRLAAYYERGLARLEDRWSGSGAAGERFRDPALWRQLGDALSASGRPSSGIAARSLSDQRERPKQEVASHPYADDLDLFGDGSLFQLVCTARTAIGEERLASWMLAPAAPDEVRRRHAQVRGLAPELDLRADIAALGDELQHTLEPGRLRAWAEARPHCLGLPARLAFAALGAAALGAGVYGLGTLQFAPFVGLVVVEVVVLHRLRDRLDAALRRRGADGEGLRVFAGVLARIPQP
ncbi:MAG: hypothetical protein ACRD1L_10520, partial [Terriglobales bacterium]